MRLSQRRGFTLIELLVVVSIIALLIAILLPALGKAKMMSLRTRCGATIRGWGLAINTYQTEWQGVFGAKIGSGLGSQWDQNPPGYGIPLATAGQTVTDPITNLSITGPVSAGIYNSISVGIDPKMRFCPADPGQYIGVATIAYYGSRPLPSYKMAYYNTPTGGTIGSGSPGIYKMTRFKDQSNKLLMCDSQADENYGDLVGFITGTGVGVIKNLIGTSSVNPRVATETYSAKDEIQARHAGRGNVLFLDSHVDNVPWSDYVANIPADNLDTDLTKNWVRFSQ